jgi:hypothetical protein
MGTSTVMEEMIYVIETCLDVEALFTKLKNAKPTEVRELATEIANDISKCLDIPEEVKKMNHRAYVDTKKQLVGMMKGGINE